mmetsp:Transcript_8794/g.29939  ORF Transcript_8794/g.29939 Transcript_8794/m.29939 type:complete len:254 (-) Transcript_8794:37-798(-)
MLTSWTSVSAPRSVMPTRSRWSRKPRTWAAMAGVTAAVEMAPWRVPQAYTCTCLAWESLSLGTHLGMASCTCGLRYSLSAIGLLALAPREAASAAAWRSRSRCATTEAGVASRLTAAYSCLNHECRKESLIFEETNFLGSRTSAKATARHPRLRMGSASRAAWSSSTRRVPFGYPPCTSSTSRGCASTKDPLVRSWCSRQCQESRVVYAWRLRVLAAVQERSASTRWYTKPGWSMRKSRMDEPPVFGMCRKST